MLRALIPRLLSLSTEEKRREAYRQVGFEPGGLTAFNRVIEDALAAEETSTLLATITQKSAMASRPTTRTTSVMMGTETLSLQKFAEPIPGTLTELSPEEIAELNWQGAEPFLHALWSQYPTGCKLFRSEKMDEYVDEAQNARWRLLV